MPTLAWAWHPIPNLKLDKALDGFKEPPIGRTVHLVPKLELGNQFWDREPGPQSLWTPPREMVIIFRQVFVVHRLFSESKKP